MKSSSLLKFAICLLIPASLTRADIKVLTEHNPNETASAAFKFKGVPAPSKRAAATDAKFSIVDGERDDNGGDLDKLHDGKLPTEEDQPAENFFFNADTEGGRV